MFNCIAYQFKCLFGPYGCSCLCMGPFRHSYTTRIMYCIMLICVPVMCAFIHEKKSLDYLILKFSPFLNETCIYLQASVSCNRLLGYKAIYRITYACFAFHLFMSILCIRISSSQEWRATLHNGFWFFKLVLILTIWTILFLFPVVDDNVQILTIVGIVSALIFIIIQDVSLIDCAYELNSYLREKGSKNCCYDKLLYILALFLYMVAVSGYVLLYFNFAMPRKCLKNRIIIIINATASFIVVLFSFFVGRHNKNKLYIPGAVTTVFVTFLTWTAIKSAPYEMVAIDFKPKTPYEAKLLIRHNKKNQIYKCQLDHKFYEFELGRELDNYVGMVLMLGSAVYCSIRSSIDYKRYGIKPARSKNFSTSQMQIITNDVELQEIKDKSKKRISGSNLKDFHGHEKYSIPMYSSLPAVNFIQTKSSDSTKKKVSIKTSNLNEKIKSKNTSRNQGLRNLEEVSADEMTQLKNSPIDSFLIHDEYYGVKYSYSWFHFVFSLAYLFIMVQMTNWYSPQTSHILNFDKSWPSFWMKITISWVALILFGWTLLCPAFCKGRILYEDPFDSMKRYHHQLKQSRVKTNPQNS